MPEIARNDPVRIATFVREALELSEDANELAEELLPLKEDSNSAIFTIELESSVGIAAFLIYQYALDAIDETGRTGSDRFTADLKTLERAAKIDAPGPRILAHAVDDGEALILATSPATHRALTGAGRSDAAIAGEPIPPGPENEQARSDAAARLLTLLKEGNAEASLWLRAIRGAGLNPDDEASETIVFNDDETALALFLLDERSIQQLLQTLNLVLESARQSAAGQMVEPAPVESELPPV